MALLLQKSVPATFSSDGSKVAFLNGSHVFIANASTKKLEAVLFNRMDAKADFGFTINKYAVAFSSNGNLFIGGSRDGVVAIWDANNGHLIREIPADSSGLLDIMSVAISPNGDLIAASTHGDRLSDHKIYVWEVATGRKIDTLSDDLRLPNIATSLAFSPDGNILIAGYWVPFVSVWRRTRIVSGAGFGKFELTNIFKMAETVNSVAFSPSGTMFAASTNEITVWNFDDLQINKRFGKPHAEFSDFGFGPIAFSPDEKSLGSAGRIFSANTRLILWNIKTGAQKTIYDSDSSSDVVTSISFFGGGQRLGWTSTRGGAISRDLDNFGIEPKKFFGSEVD